MGFLSLIYLLQPLYWYSFQACKLSQWKLLNVKGRLSSYISVELFTKLWESSLLRKKNTQEKVILRNFLNSLDVISYVWSGKHSNPVYEIVFEFFYMNIEHIFHYCFDPCVLKFIPYIWLDASYFAITMPLLSREY